MSNTLENFVAANPATNHSSRVFIDYELSQSTIDFGDVTYAEDSDPKNLVIENVGTASILVRDIKITGDFSTKSSVSSIILSGNSESLAIICHPTAMGALTGTVTFLINDSKVPVTVNLKANGVKKDVSGWDHKADIDNMLTGLYEFIKRAVQPAISGKTPSVSVEPSSVLFSGTTEVGKESAAVTVTIMNSGSSDLIISDISVTGDFEVKQ